MLRIVVKPIESVAYGNTVCYDCDGRATCNIELFENEQNSSTFDWYNCEICWNFNKKVIEEYEVKDVLYFIAMRDGMNKNCEACNKSIGYNTFYLGLKFYNKPEKRYCCINSKCVEYLKLLLC